MVLEPGFEVKSSRGLSQCSSRTDTVSPMLSHDDIITTLAAGVGADGTGASLSPFDASFVQPSSVDIHLGFEFLSFLTLGASPVIDPRERQPMDRTAVAPGDTFTLPPGEVVLGSTFERLSLGTDLAARLEGKSSLGRLGLLTHATAGFIDPGFQGHVTLELVNLNSRPIALYPGMRIGQLCFFRLEKPTDVPYGGGGLGSHYQGQSGPVESRYYLNTPPPFDVYREVSPS